MRGKTDEDLDLTPLLCYQTAELDLVMINSRVLTIGSSDYAKCPYMVQRSNMELRKRR